ncbi:vacuolar sorting-associated protein [Aspergillus costaricaensis CBS 115574]|uniref:Vacuolar sorting-associated protein n=1 Tax=Aspergillus costaricaensis CBS 115574 TaxID=1448317 RepID=A0ACD1I9P7_9EURO|nr:vacuolar sorting-associated protein [Aspergillus costaricaensis CBS 115574]RAK87045.1 vacuolar sorting-associated protein [Aspergillus costaricaensis CBS 115574]
MTNYSWPLWPITTQFCPLLYRHFDLPRPVPAVLDPSRLTDNVIAPSLCHPSPLGSDASRPLAISPEDSSVTDLADSLVAAAPPTSAVPIGNLVTLPPSTTSTPGDQSGLVVPPSSRSSSSDLEASPGIVQQMIRSTRVAIVTLASLIAYVLINSAARAVNPSAFIWYAEDHDEQSWIASSPSWLDRKACRWLGMCGTAHFRLVRARYGQREPTLGPWSPDDEAHYAAWRDAQFNDSQQPAWDEAERSRRQIPEYVFQYAPLVYLSSHEQFWPGDIAEHLYHVTPMLNYTPIHSDEEHPTLQDLDQLNEWQEGEFVYLTSNDNVEDRPPWIEGEKNIPDDPDDDLELSWPDWDGRIDGPIPGDTPEERSQWYDTGRLSSSKGEDDSWSPEDLGYLRPEDLADEDVRTELRKRFGGEPIHVEKTGGRSNAPAILLVMDKGHGVVDAFWFYFYSFNLGNVVLNVRFGNHVGDWEHCLVRFHDGKPKALFFSAHSAGEAYSYEAVEKVGQRPVIYSAMGTHAMYATPGIHAYILPWGLLHDQTDRGPLWDPLLNAHAYTYDYDSDNLRASTATPSAPIEWFYFNGHWGDKFYPLGDQRQYRFAGQYHYVNGPVGPRFKHLNRHKVCQQRDEEVCVIKNYIGEEKRAKRWAGTRPEHEKEHD